jgi:hypothetical protein
MVRFAKQNFTGTKPMASARKSSNSRDRSTTSRRARGAVKTARAVANVLTADPDPWHYAICVRNDRYPASLELRKLYPFLQDDFAEKHDMIRVVDESGEDYLYPASYFLKVELPTSIKEELVKIA